MYEAGGIKWGTPGFGNPGGVVNWHITVPEGLMTTLDVGSRSTYFLDLMRSAFSLWETVANIDFVEVASRAASNISVSWMPIDGPHKVLGYAEYSYNGALRITGTSITFDAAETWNAGESAAASGSNFFATALHEIGHAIGLDHVDDRTSIMNPIIYASTLSTGDVEAIQGLYGAGNGGRGVVPTPGPDRITATDGADSIFALAGRDTVSALAGNDTVYGNQGDDQLLGGLGGDQLFGGQDNDTVYGGEDGDALYGNLGHDTLYGDAGNDVLHGGRDRDTLFGGQDNDTLNGGLGDDRLTGGTGSDVFVFAPAQGNDVVADFRFAEGDRLDLQGQSYTVGANAQGAAVLSLDGSGTIVLLGLPPELFQAGFVA